MKKIKILFVLPSLRGGGAEKVILNIIKKLNRNKFEPELAVLKFEGENKNLIQRDVKVFNLKKTRARYAIFSLVKLINKERPDLILSSVEQTTIMTRFAKFFLKYNPVIINRCAAFPSLNTKGILSRLLNLLAFKGSDYVIAISKAMKEDLINNFNIKANKIKLIYNPVDIKNISKLAKESVEKEYFKNKPIILSCGRLAEEKGLSYLIKAFKTVLREFPKASLLILGKGKKERELKDLTERIGIQKNIKFLGFQNNPYKFMTRADVFILSSLYEGMPNSLLEAVACGVPVVSTDCKSGPREILAPNTDFYFETNSVELVKYGILVPPKNSGLLAQGVLKLLNNTSLREKYSQLQQERAIYFSVDKIINQYEVFFLEILNIKI